MKEANSWKASVFPVQFQYPDPVDDLLANPGYVKLVDALPKTATGKVQRAVLRKQGVAGALDAQA